MLIRNSMGIYKYIYIYIEIMGILNSLETYRDYKGILLRDFHRDCFEKCLCHLCGGTPPQLPCNPSKPLFRA